MRREAAAADFTEDAVLGGRLMLRQPRRGHRFGHDAILLAAATAAEVGEHAVELGAGVGAAGLALASRIDGLSVTLVEIDATLTALAADNICSNGFAERARAVALDATATARAFAAAGLKPGCAARVLMNPPFNDASASHVSPDLARRLAHVASPQGLAPWVRSAARLLAPGGTLTLIWRADRLAEALAALTRGFGDVTILPVHPRRGAPAIRVLISAAKASRAPLALLPGFVLAEESGQPTAEAEAVLREGHALALLCN